MAQGVGRGRSLCVAAACALAAASRPARAASPAVERDVDARLAYVTRVLELEQPSARAWRAGWVVGFGGVTVVESVLAAATTSPDVRATAISGGIKAGLGLGVRLFSPFTAAHAAATLRELPEATAAERRAKLVVAESLLRAAAREERFGRSWMPLVASATVNLTSAFVLWAGYQRYGAGWFGLGSGVAVSQLQYWTQPVFAAEAYERYGRDVLRGVVPEPPRTRASPAVSWSIGPGPGGAAVLATF